MAVAGAPLQSRMLPLKAATSPVWALGSSLLARVGGQRQRHPAAPQQEAHLLAACVPDRGAGGLDREREAWGSRANRSNPPTEHTIERNRDGETKEVREHTDTNLERQTASLTDRQTDRQTDRGTK